MAGNAFFVLRLQDDITPGLDRISSVVRPNLQATVRESAKALMAEMRRLAPLGRHYSLGGAMLSGGNLRRSLRFVVGDLGAVLMGAGYGRFVIGGTQPHAIDAKNATSLRFWWARRGTQFVGPHVNHPGTKPNDFRAAAMAAALEGGVMSRIYDQMLGATLDGEAL